MNFAYYIISIVLIYFLFSFLLPLIIFPNHLFKTKIQKTEKLRKFAARFKRKNKEETLKKVYSYIIKNYRGNQERRNLVLQLWKHFYTDVEKILEKKQFLPCHVQNLVLITLLVNLGFKEKEIERKEEMSPFGTVHQYVLVKINKKIFKVDPFFKICQIR